jgi:GNAT superfamily N-acetyltransferase
VSTEALGPPGGPVRFEPADPLTPPAADLVAVMEAEMKALYGTGEGHVGVPMRPEELGPPGGVYLVGWAGDDPVAGGGVRTIGPGIGEIKRMYVRPDWRGRGVAKGLLAALELAAVDRLGLSVVRLDTGPKQPGAQRLYEREGYRGIGNYNANPHASFWGQKSLRPEPPSAPS